MEYILIVKLIADTLIKPMGRVKFDAFIKEIGTT